MRVKSNDRNIIKNDGQNKVKLSNTARIKTKNIRIYLKKKKENLINSALLFGTKMEKKRNLLYRIIFSKSNK